MHVTWNLINYRTLSCYVHKYERLVGVLAYLTPSLLNGTFRLWLHQVCHITIFHCRILVDAAFPIGNPSPRPVPNDPTFVLRPGEIVCCQTNVRTTLEGYSARAGDASFWRDPSLSPEKWNTAVRPAVVLDVGINKRTKLWFVHVACIGRGVLSSTDGNVVPISPLSSQDSVTPSPSWPLSDSYCYIFPRPMKFLCYPGEVLHFPSRSLTGKKRLT